MKYMFWNVLVILITSTLIAHAQEQKGIDEHLENLSGQYAECTAYYELVYYAMDSANEMQTANAYKGLANNAMFYSLLLANEGREKDMAVNVTNSRIDMYKKKMKQEINNRNENISLLINNYHYSCEKLMKDPPSEVNKLLKNAIKDSSKK